jgi:hypothetical protein
MRRPERNCSGKRLFRFLQKKFNVLHFKLECGHCIK